MENTFVPGEKRSRRRLAWAFCVLDPLVTPFCSHQLNLNAEPLEKPSEITPQGSLQVKQEKSWGRTLGDKATRQGAKIGMAALNSFNKHPWLARYFQPITGRFMDVKYEWFDEGGSRRQRLKTPYFSGEFVVRIVTKSDTGRKYPRVTFKCHSTKPEPYAIDAFSASSSGEPFINSFPTGGFKWDESAMNVFAKKVWDQKLNIQEFFLMAARFLSFEVNGGALVINPTETIPRLLEPLDPDMRAVITGSK